jgi:hypothetical protein
MFFVGVQTFDGKNKEENLTFVFHILILYWATHITGGWRPFINGRLIYLSMSLLQQILQQSHFYKAKIKQKSCAEKIETSLFFLQDFAVQKNEKSARKIYASVNSALVSIFPRFGPLSL